MKAAFMDIPEHFTIEDVPVPKPGNDEVLIKVHTCAVCGSDLTIYKMGFIDRILGHEFAGEIAGLGENVTGWDLGQRVTVEPQLICGECHWCRSGLYNLCDSLQYTGLASNGGFAEYAVVPAYQLHSLPDIVTMEQGALIEPLGVALRGIQQTVITHGSTVVIFGCGAVGLFSALWSKSAGAGLIIAVDPATARREALHNLAIQTIDPSVSDPVSSIFELTKGLGAESIFECSGSGSAQVAAIESVRKGGTIVLLGIGYESVELPLMQLTMKEITMKGSLGYRSLVANSEFDQAIEAIVAGTIDLSSVPLSRYDLNGINDAFTDSKNGTVSKAVVHIIE